MESQPSEAFKNNTLGTAGIAELALEYGVDRFVLISTDKAGALKTFGDADFHPIGGAVTGSLKALGIDKRLDQCVPSATLCDGGGGGPVICAA